MPARGQATRLRREEEARRAAEAPLPRIPPRGRFPAPVPVPQTAPPPVPELGGRKLEEISQQFRQLQQRTQIGALGGFADQFAQRPPMGARNLTIDEILRQGLNPPVASVFTQGNLPPQVTTPHSPFALEAGLFHNAMMFTSGRILEAVDTQSRNFLPRQITDVIAALLPWRDWGFGSYQEALRALGYTEIPGAGTWMKDDEIASAATITGGGGGQTTAQYVTQRAGFGGGGGSLRSPNFSTLINWRI